MKEVKIYQVFKGHEGPTCIGKVETEKWNDVFFHDTVWHLCNWTCWLDKPYSSKITESGVTFYPNENAQGYCNSDIIVPIADGTYMCADSVGWHNAKTFEEALEWTINHLKKWGVF